MKTANIGRIAVKIIVSLLLVALAFQISLSAVSLQFDINDEHGRLQAQLTERIRETLSIWAVIKGVSVIISTLETFQMEAGVSFGAQATVSINPVGGLAVVDNILDQVSNILLWATGALSILKILLTVSIWVSLRIIVPVCCALIIVAIWSKKYSGQLKRIIAGIVIICLGICLAVPLSLEMSNLVKNSILSVQIYKTTSEISSLGAHIEGEGEELNDPSFLDMVRRGAASVSSFFNSIKSYVDRLIENIIDYIMIFIVVNLIIPILTIFGLKALLGALLKHIGFTMAGLKSPGLLKKSMTYKQNTFSR